MSSTTNWKPLIYSISIVLLIGIIVTLVSQSFDLPETTQSNFTNGILLLVQNNTYFTLGTIPIIDLDINIPIPIHTFVSIFGTTFENLLTDNIIAMSYIPTVILIPLLIVLIIGIAYPIIYVAIDVIEALVP